MNPTVQLVLNILVIAVGAAAVGFVIVWTVIKSEDPARMVFRWVLTVPVIAYMIWVVAPLVGKGGYAGAFGGVPLAAFCGLVLVFIWRRALTALVANPIASLYDGGATPPDPHPAYSVAQSRQKQGRYLEAIDEVRKQLERFPTDVEGQLLIAQIQAENLKDLPAADLTIERFCGQPGHAPQNIAFALYSMADWSLSITQNRAAAQRYLEQIIALLPDSEFAIGAAHRLASLDNTEMILDHDQKKFPVKEGIQNLGLARARAQIAPLEADPAEAAARYVKHLEQFPLDLEAREKLSVIYADHYQRLDLAKAELDQMIDQPNQPSRLVAHWLNLLADLQVRHGATYETVSETLQRIIDREPDFAPAEMARKRLALLKLELKARQENPAVKLGSYEQNIGLKRGLPGRQL
jgi:tetratricopeptide (TPR) repeat protein